MNEYTYYHSSEDTAMALRAEAAAKKSFSTIALAAAVYSIAALVLVTLVDILLSVVGFYSNPFIADNMSAVLLIRSSICMYLMALPIYYLIIKRVPVFPVECRRMSIMELLGIFLVSRFALLVGSTISNFIINVFTMVFGYTPIDTTTDIVENTPIWLLILIVVVIGPIVEELVYRKWMIDRLGAYGDVSAILFSSVLFGLGHGNLFQFAYAFLLGLILGYMYTRTGNMWYSTGLHMLTNFLGSIAVLPLIPVQDRVISVMEGIGDDMAAFEDLILNGENAQFSSDLALILGYSAISYALAIAGAVIFFMYMRRLYLKPRLLTAVGGRGMTRAAIVNVGMLVFALVTAGEFILSVLP